TVAPQPQGGPPEKTFQPSADAEKAQLPTGFVEVQNPAFPSQAVPAAVPVNRGRRYEEVDLQPYFAKGVLAQAKAEYDGGRYGRAFEILKGQGNALPVRYLRAVAALKSGNASYAAGEMGKLATEYTALRDRCLVHAGVANEDLGRFADAAASFEQVPQGSRLFVDARFGLSRVRRQQGDLEGAMKALAPLATLPAPTWGRDVAAEALVAIADLAQRAKDPEVEREALVTLWASHPLSPLAKNAETRLKNDKKAQALSTQAQVTRGEQLIEAHRNAKGLEVLSPLLPTLALPQPLACRAHFAYGKALRKERSHTKAIEVLSPVVEKCTDPDLRARAMYVLGSSQSIVAISQGTKTYEALARDYPGHAFADDALFFAADLYAKAGDQESALKRLQEVVEKYPGGDFASESLFKVFWVQRAQKKTEQALKTLSLIEERYAKAEEPYDYERARYWRARLMEDSGDKKAAAKIFAEVATEHPATYYGLMARSKVGELDPSLAGKVSSDLVFPRESQGPWPLYAGPVGEDPHFLAGVELLRLGFPESASSELFAVSRARQPAESLRLLVHVLATAGDSRGAHAIARVALRKDLGGRITPDKRPLWEVAYPNAFRELIEKHCATAQVEPDLLQALMREESALDPKALSWAGALGLTQLMPGTAKQVARKYKISARITPERLLDPDLNIRLGALNLGELLQQFKGVKQFAVAGYNAGPGAVNRWKSERPLDEWVEEIPIAETRGYVKRVLRSYNTYQLLYAKPAPTRQAAADKPAAVEKKARRAKQ
ncbi:MAG TPA: transglycosylase SLT domain-containing protein, partial [Longimicrobium sp.]|nr:transglycosylase SLT domain-containing protein [Longimicrobium sp.]